MPKNKRVKLAKTNQTLSENGLYLSDVSPDDKPWDDHRANADLVRDLYQEIGYEQYTERIQDCSKFLEFVLKQFDDEQKFKLSAAQFCRVRHCPICQWRRSLMWRARFFKVLPKIFEKYPDSRFIFLTLTVENCAVDDLRETITWMNQSWIKLTKRKNFPAIGWVKSLEITQAKDSLAHPHFHIIMMVKPSYFKSSKYLSKEKWIALWRAVLKVDYDPSIWITAVKNNDKKLYSGIMEALSETLKYSIKESDLTSNSHWLKSVTNQLYKTRSISLGGIFKTYLSEEEVNNPKDLIHSEIDESEILETDPSFLFVWKEMMKKYQSF